MSPTKTKNQSKPWYVDFRFFLLLFAVLFVFLLMSIFGRSHSAGPGGGLGMFATGKEAPDIEVVDLDGQKVKLSQFKGKVIFLNFWATWCSPCRKEVPTIQSLYKKYLNNPDFMVFAVSCDAEGAKEVGKYVRSKAVTFPVFLDPEMKAAAIYGIAGFPETFLIDRNGKIAQKFVGPRQWDDPRFRKMIDELLAEPAAANP